MHIGNARTALYNYLFAKHNDGQFVVRIEDTDRARHSEEAVTAIIEGLNWLDLPWDGEITSQFERRARHIEVAQSMLDNGKAYKCFCTEQELEEMRVAAKEKGKPTFYDRRWRDKDESEHPDKPYVVRLKAPLDGATTIHDMVQGEVTVQNEQLDDFILLRSDGTPTYMLSVVCDDNDMGITHIIRGDDHLSNTFRQRVIFDAMGWNIPQFAHLPMILGQDGAKLSKRHGAVSLEDFIERGYLPETVFNYLLRLGWSHGDDEIISRAQAIEWFTLDNITKSAAKFDYDKLENLNAHYIKQCDNERLLALTIDRLKHNHELDIGANDLAAKFIMMAMDELKSRAKSIVQIADESCFFAKTIPYDFDDKAKDVLSAAPQETLKALRDAMQELGDFTKDSIQALCKDVAATHAEGKMGKIGMPLRAALTGQSVSPTIFHVAEIIGKDETIARLDYAIKTFKA
jgi:glutamyl-tRNA synthetase